LRAIAVIPARYGSTRFPGKPLARETGKFLIQHVYERAQSAPGVERAIVATDDQRIAEAVASFGGEYAMTRPDHTSGTDRVAEVARQIDCEEVINIQGDEPEVEPEFIERLLTALRGTPHPVATLACSFDDLRRQGIKADPADPNCVKVVASEGRALYFSRSAVPYRHNAGADYDGPYLHLGVYAYRRDFLMKLTTWRQTPLEKLESLEQLRVLEHGHSISVAVVERAVVGVDTPEDYAAFVERERARLAGRIG
jgi:3-deoxy-manno-octulosonate cytidylyltransferase (CMP-KDO synthetase)